jgi:hypothetical protein
MQLKLENLRVLIKEVLSESNTYFGASHVGSEVNPAFSSAGPKPYRPQDTKNLNDEVALKEMILNIFLSIPDIPQNTNNSYSDTMVSEDEIAVVLRTYIGHDAGHPLGDFGEVAYNHGAAEAASVLIDDPDDLESAAKKCARGLLYPDEEYDRATTRMYESKSLLIYPEVNYED